jgi:hypothetical protein
MTSIISVSPLPGGTSVSKVREVFINFSVERICVKDDKAYIKFKEAADLEAVAFRFEDLRINELGNAEI